MDIGRKLADLERRLAAMETSPRLSHAAIDDTSVEVRDGTGKLRGLLGVQGDGTTAVNIVNGGVPPVPATPTVAPAIGGVAVGWDGTFANDAVPPLDWSRVEVHTSSEEAFLPDAGTLRATVETMQGGIAYVPASGDVYACLLSRNTSGVASEPSAVVGPYTPKPVAGEIGIGEIVETMISDGAVTTPKLFANAVTTPKLAAGSVDATAIAADAITGKTITGGTITGSTIQTEATGERITLNEAGANKVLVYNDTEAVGELSAQGLLVKGTSGAIMWLRPNITYPQLSLSNAADTNRAGVAVVEPEVGDANLQMVSGKFPGSGYDAMVWHTYLGRDFASIERRTTGLDPERIVGGRMLLEATHGYIAFLNADTPAQNTRLDVEANITTVRNGRFAVDAPASTFSAMYIDAKTAHTGPLLRVYRDSDKFSVDKDGHTYVAGRVRPMTAETGTITLQSGWTDYDATNYGTASVRRSADGRAYLIGRIRAGTATNGTLVATIPNSAYWPVYRFAVPHVAPQAAVDASLVIGETGEIRVWDISGTLTNISLANITWPTW